MIEAVLNGFNGREVKHMKKTFTLLLTLLLLCCFTTTALAYDYQYSLQAGVERIENPASNPEVQEAIENNFNTIKAYTDTGKDTGNFAGLKWIVKSLYASQRETKKFQTDCWTFTVGGYTAKLDAETIRTSPGKRGETVYDRITISRAAFIDAFVRETIYGEIFDKTEEEIRQLVEEALDTESYIDVGAIITIYHDKNGNGKVDSGEYISQIMRESDIEPLAAIFPPENRQDLHSRFQKIRINFGKQPDFYPTPEGATKWTESFAKTAITYTGKPGQEITFPVNLYNVGAKATTDYRAVWEGQGADPVKGWQGTDPVWGIKDVELDKGQSKTYNVTVTFPEPGQPHKLVFKANVNGETPKTEENQSNNLMVIAFKPEGVDLAITGKAQSTRIKLPQNKNIQMAGVVIYTITRKDGGTDPVQAKLTMYGPAGTKTENINISNKSTARSYIFKTSTPGKYTSRAEVWPTVKETHPPDNKTQNIIIEFIRDKLPDPKRQDEETNLRGGLTG